MSTANLEVASVMVEMSSDQDSDFLINMGNPDSTLRFLLVEDCATDAYLIQTHLKNGLDLPLFVERVETLAAAIESLAGRRFDLVLLDPTLPDSSGIGTFYSVLKHTRNDPVLILSSDEAGETAVKAVGDGAQDYILKHELSAHTLALEVRFAIERSKRIGAEQQLEVAHEQIRIARKLQKGLYPLSAPTCDGFDIAGAAWAAEHACGDYYDFLPMGGENVGVVVGDVSGHGLGPALKMVEARAALHAFSEYENNLGKLIAGVHRVFCGGQHFAEGGLFLTLFLGRLDTAKRVLHYSSAGHPAFHLTADGNVHTSVRMDYPVGIVDAMSEQDDEKILLNSGDIVVIPTDGFYEAVGKGESLFGVDRMMDVVRNNRDQTANGIVRAMYTASCSYTPETPQKDDMAAIVIKVL